MSETYAHLGPPVMFRQFVEREAFALQPGLQFEAQGADKVAIVIEYLFHSAQTQMLILSQELGAEIYGRKGVQEAALAFLSRDERARLYVLTERDLPSANLFVRALSDERFRARLIVRSLKGQKIDHAFNFVLSDQPSFCLAPNRHVMRALVQFRSPAADTLRDTFNRLWVKATMRA